MPEFTPGRITRLRLSLEVRGAIYRSVAVLTRILNFLYPPRCAACGRRFDLDANYRVCRACLDRAERLAAPLCSICGHPLGNTAGREDRCGACLDAPPSYARARAIARYRASAEDDRRSLAAMIRRHKYGLDQSLGRALAEYLGAELPCPAEDIDLVVPVPLHRRRLRWRGFNQGALLAAAVAERLGRPLELGTLVRTRPTTPQTSHSHDERRRNMRGAFRVKRSERIRGRRVLLVDDVMTTGATVNECARALLAVGARRVEVLTLARVL